MNYKRLKRQIRNKIMNRCKIIKIQCNHSIYIFDDYTRRQKEFLSKIIKGICLFKFNHDEKIF